MVAKIRSIAWVEFPGAPPINHLADTFVWKEGSQKPLTAICGGEKHAVVYRKDGIYCRYCVGHEAIV